jgi:NADH-quinone oxidoreductase subunit E
VREKSTVLSDDEKREIEAAVADSHDPRSACIEALRIVQAHRRWVSDEAIADLAAMLGMTRDELDNVASFYSLIFRKPVGEKVIKVCDSVVCWALGSQSLIEYLEQRLGIKAGETTPDGRFTLIPICCVGDCDHAPVLMINDTTIEDVTPEILDRIIAGEEVAGRR